MRRISTKVEEAFEDFLLMKVKVVSLFFPLPPHLLHCHRRVLQVRKRKNSKI